VVPDYHGRYATVSPCKVRAIHFAEGSFSGSPALQKLDDEVARAYNMRHEPFLAFKAVAVRVTARAAKVWYPSPVPGDSSVRPGYELRLRDADGGRLIDPP
jgi:hypothetical protein